MKLSSFKVGEYAIDSDGEVVKIIKKTGRGDNLTIELEEIKVGTTTPTHRASGDIFEANNNYGTTSFGSNQWKRWTPPTKVNGDPKILKRIEEARKSLEELENAYKASLKPKVEYIPGTAYDLYHIGGSIGVFEKIDSDGDYIFIVPDNEDYIIRSDVIKDNEVRPLTNPNQKKAANIIYNFHKEGEFPVN